MESGFHCTLKDSLFSSSLIAIIHTLASSVTGTQPSSLYTASSEERKREREREREQSKGMVRIASILESSQHTVSWSVGRSRPKALHNKPPSLIHSIKLSRGNNTKSSNNYKPVTTLAPRKLRSTRPHSGARRQDILHQTFTTFALLSMSLQPPFLAAQRRRSTGFFTFYNLSSLSLSPSV